MSPDSWKRFFTGAADNKVKQMSLNLRPNSIAQLIAVTLSGAWRENVEEISISERELAVMAPLLLGSGAAPLVWRRVAQTTLQTSPAALELEQAYYLHTVHALPYQHKIKQAFMLLRSHGIEPILIKGWAHARIYPELGLRPYGDIDLCVAPDQYSSAVSILDRPEGRECWVDLHKGLGRLDNTSWHELYERSKLVELNGSDIRLLAAEDHLRVSCVHFLDHGAWRPIWLCDIGAALESTSADFDWDVCLGKDKRRAKWVVSAIRLAQQLLNARIDHCPAVIRNARLPRWLIPNVLKQWERPGIKEHAPPELIMRSLRHPIRVPKALVNRWSNPIEATIRMNGEFNELPRLPFQLCDYIIKYTAFINRLPRLLQAAR